MGISFQSQRARISESGRVSIPADMRRELGLERGGPVRIDLVDGQIRIRTMREIMEKVQAKAKASGWDNVSVDDFLQYRAEERVREAREHK